MTHVEYDLKSQRKGKYPYIRTTTVKTDSEKCPLLAVRSNKPIPKEKQMDCMAVIRGVQAKAPVSCYDVLVENICDTGVDIVATGVLK